MQGFALKTRSLVFVLLFVSVFFFPHLLFSSGVFLRCEVMDVGFPEEGTRLDGHFGKVGFLLLHHAAQGERGKVSAFFRSHSGCRISFKVGSKVCNGMLYRLPFCFGRALVVYDYLDCRGIKRGDIVEIISSGVGTLKKR